MPKVLISVDVGDLNQAESFYVDALGCEFVKKPYPRMTVVSAGGVEIWLVEKPVASSPFPGSDPVRTYERHWTPVHMDFCVHDIEGTLSQIVEHHGSYETGEKGKWAFCADPFGNGFCLIKAK